MQSGFYITKRLTNIPGRVQHICGDHDIVAIRRNPLPVQGFTDVNNNRLYKRIFWSEVLLGMEQKDFRYVAVPIFFNARLIRFESSQKAGSSPPGTSPNFQYSDFRSVSR